MFKGDSKLRQETNNRVIGDQRANTRKLEGDSKLRQETNDHGIGTNKHVKGDQRANPRNPEGYGTGKEAETSYGRSNLKETFKAGFRLNAYDIAKERTKEPPHPENEIPLTRAYDHPLRSKREFGGGLAGTPQEARNFRESLYGRRRLDLEDAIRMDDDDGRTQGSRDYLHYLELYNRDHYSPVASSDEGADNQNEESSDEEVQQPRRRRTPSSSSSSSSSDSSDDDTSTQVERLSVHSSSSNNTRSSDRGSHT